MTKSLSIAFAVLVANLFSISGSCGESGTNALRFFATSDTPIPGWRYIDTRECPKVGYITNSPSFVITQLQTVVTSTAALFDKEGRLNGKFEAAVTFTMFPADAEKLSEFTAQNAGRRMLIMLGDKPLTAPRLREAFETPTLQLGLSRYKEPEQIINGLKRLADSP